MKRVLVVDDEVEMLDLIKRYLLREGFEVLTCSNPYEVISLIDFFSPDVLILDIMLPGTDGFELCKNIRHNNNNLPIIFISAKSEESDKVLGLGLGGDDYLTKPFSLNEMVARIKAILRRLNQQPNNLKSKKIINIGHIEANLLSREVYILGKKIKLTAKEFDLLVLMIKNPNRIFNKEELYERIWNNEALGDSRTVIVHINRLREKIEKTPHEPEYLKTVWGVGYKFEKLEK